MGIVIGFVVAVVIALAIVLIIDRPSAKNSSTPEYQYTPENCPEKGTLPTESNTFYQLKTGLASGLTMGRPSVHCLACGYQGIPGIALGPISARGLPKSYIHP